MRLPLGRTLASFNSAMNRSRVCGEPNLTAAFNFLFFRFTVFHVTDLNGNKVTDQSVINYIEQVNLLLPEGCVPMQVIFWLITEI